MYKEQQSSGSWMQFYVCHEWWMIMRGCQFNRRSITISHSICCSIDWPTGVVNWRERIMQSSLLKYCIVIIAPTARPRSCLSNSLFNCCRTNRCNCIHLLYPFILILSIWIKFSKKKNNTVTEKLYARLKISGGTKKARRTASASAVAHNICTYGYYDTFFSLNWFAALWWNLIKKSII